ncbi:MAG: riboflavin biosynthesis protein RibF [Marinilabiliales bacterium]|nr:MAG: riboflavin biosynthesis protein RibF [Marinilabiliales bacterium]
MEVHYGLDKEFNIKNPVITTGSFDGVHVGHKTILNRLRKLAKEVDGESVLITFHPHPRKILYPDTAGRELRLINSQSEKIKLLRTTKLDHLIIVEFTLEFSRMTSADFIRKVIAGKLHARKVVVGFNHHFGHNREGDYEHLYELGKYFKFDVEEIPQQDIDNETVSSTKIRKALREGNIQRANAYLDHHYIIRGVLEKGDPRMKALGFPTLRLPVEEESKLIPPDGLYAVHLISGNLYYRGIIKIRRPGGDTAVQATNISIQLHLFEYDNDIAGKTATIFFHKQMRNEAIFTNGYNLQDELQEAREETEELIY